ncbi:hypothetical protein SAY87_032364 [Trapa incisa]|uniref:Uncharacterized protein n=1 Tax=Trapa incisa TaxID=236973 RepID=A0AAN7GNV6_9MYRT|nr:hypothetical protein SAY87_032364 [Trapa incisa]
MEASKSKVDAIKPVILKAGIPLAISIVGFVCSKFIAGRRRADSICHESRDEEEEEGEMGLVVHDHKSGTHEEILGLGRILERLQERAWSMEMKFLRYCELRDREALLLEVKRSVEMEIGRVESMSREVKAMELEQKRVVEIELEYVNVIEEMRCLRLENAAMQRKVRRLMRKVKEQSDFMRDSKLRIKAQEREISSARSTLENERDDLKKMEGEIGEMRRAMKQLQQEKDQLWVGLSSMEGSVLKMKQEGATMEDLKQQLKVLENFQKEHAADEKELVYLRLSNACLKHEMMRNLVTSPGNYHNLEMTKSLELTKSESSEVDLAEEEDKSQDHDSGDEAHSPKMKTSANHFSKRKKLLHKLRRWVDGTGKEHSQLKVRPADDKGHGT